MKIWSLLLILSGAIGCVEGPRGEQGPEGPQGEQGPKGPAGENGNMVGDHGGKRIKIQSYVTDAADDGAQIGRALFDTTLGTECQFAMAADGVTRCLPVTRAIVAYSDPGCTKPIAVSYPACDGTMPKFAIQQSNEDTCSQSQEFFALDGAVAAPQAYYSQGPATCQKNLPSAKALFFAVGAKMTLEDFEAATLQLN